MIDPVAILNDLSKKHKKLSAWEKEFLRNVRLLLEYGYHLSERHIEKLKEMKENYDAET
jgi:hypothetical protein